MLKKNSWVKLKTKAPRNPPTTYDPKELFLWSLKNNIDAANTKRSADIGKSILLRISTIIKFFSLTSSLVSSDPLK